MNNKRYGFLRTVIFKDKGRKDLIYRPLLSDDLTEVEKYYDKCIKEHLESVNHFNEVAIFNYQMCSYVSNNFSEADTYRRNIRGEVI